MADTDIAQAEEVATIPLAEERLEVGKREVESARVRVRVAVDALEERIPAELSRDEVEVRRVPRNVAVTELPAVRTEGETMIIPVVEEQLVVEKRMVLVEEIHVLRRTVTERRDIPVTLRAERAEIERSEAGEGAGR
jgi:uncharacterized protein (TIGR02271 family)